MNNESQILNVPIEDIVPNRFQPRLNFDDVALKELASSIKEHGIIQPLVLRRLGEKYEIIAGERRYKAAKMAGLTSVPAIISAMDDQKSAEVAIVENIQRRDLSSIEEAKSYKALLDKGYLTQEELAKKMGLSQSAISNKLRLLSLSESVQNALMEGKISERHARSLLQLESLEDQDKWLNLIIKERITVRELDRRIKEESSEEDIPLVELTPSIEAIKENAIDIVPSTTNTKEEVIPKSSNENKPMPNKFFNFLEDEQANMNVVEPKEEEVEEEIEMLDFLAPEVPTEQVVVEQTITQDIEEKVIPKDITMANNLIDETLSKLQENYQVKLEKDETNNEIKYIITVDKN